MFTFQEEKEKKEQEAEMAGWQTADPVKLTSDQPRNIEKVGGGEI